MTGPPDLIPRVIVSPGGIAYIYKRSPWTAMWYSVILPGFGHLFVGQTFKGLALMSWEILINTLAHLNLGIWYTVLGRYEEARAVVNYQWLLVYPFLYVFAIADSYRVAADSIGFLDIESRQKERRFERISVSAIGVYATAFRHPLMASFWSMAMSGLGHLYCSRPAKALVLMSWYLTIIVKSGISQAAFFTVLGQYDLAHQVVDYQWLLFWPSIFVFGLVDAYDDTTEQNVITMEAFRYRMRKYLKNEHEWHGAQQLP